MAKIYIEFNVVSTSDIILVVREKSDPLAEVFRQFYSTPHSQRNLTVIDLNPVVHQVEIWTTTNGTTLGQLKGSCDIDASLTNDLAFSLIQFIVDGIVTGTPNFDPASGQDQYVNPELDGKSYVVFRPGYGPLVWGLHIQTIAGGGFEFIDGQQFGAQEEYTIMVFNKVSTQTAGTGSGFFSGVYNLLFDEDYSISMRRKLIVPSTNATAITLTIVDPNLIPAGTIIGFSTNNSDARYLKVTVPIGNAFRVFNSPRQEIYLGQGEEAAFIKVAGGFHVVYWTGDVRRVGERVKADGKPPLNSVPETGGWLLKTDYPRLFDWYVNELPMDDLGTGTDDVTPTDANKPKWIIGATKFWVPDRRNLFDRNTDGTRFSGDLQGMEVQEHWHDVGTQNISSNPRFNRAPPTPVDKRHPVRSWNAGGQTDVNQSSTTDLNYNSNGTAPTETRPINAATNVYRII